jgi:hypothetical protein
MRQPTMLAHLLAPRVADVDLLDTELRLVITYG